MRLAIGDEVALVREGKATVEVVVHGFMRVSVIHGNASVSEERVYVEHESGDCEWVRRQWLRRIS